MNVSRFHTAFEITLSAVLTLSLVAFYAHVLPVALSAYLIPLLAFVGTAPVIFFAFRGVVAGEWASMDMLASVALLFSLLSREWASSVFIALMLSGARSLSLLTQARTKKNIESLLALKPESAKVRRGEKIETVPLESLAVGDTVVMDIGERVAVDGTVISGDAALDESSLTGEAYPVDKSPGSKVFTGTLVSSGSLEVRTEKVGKDTTLEKIITLVESAREQRSKIYTVAERFGKVYLVSIFLFSGALFFFSRDLKLVLSVVLVVCADDVAIAIPLAYLSAIGSAAKRGVIIKGSAHMEALGRIKTFAFDKTGTLTKGNLAVAGIFCAAGRSENEVLTYSAIASRTSPHPLSRAIIAYANERHIPDTAPEASRAIGGKGIVATYRDDHITLGRMSFLESEGIPIPEEIRAEVLRLGDEGKSVSLTAVNGKVVGIIALTDEIKTEAKASLTKLRALGATRLVMLTGDNEHVAKVVADELGIDTFYAALLPEDKVEKIKALAAEGEIAMVGDGVNDAAALSAATVGIAMGAIGYDTAIESAEIVLMRDDLSEIPHAIELARHVHGISIEDFWIWGATNALGLILVFTGFIGPAGAAAYNFISDFFPLANSVRARRGI